MPVNFQYRPCYWTKQGKFSEQSAYWKQTSTTVSQSSSPEEGFTMDYTCSETTWFNDSYVSKGNFKNYFLIFVKRQLSKQRYQVHTFLPLIDDAKLLRGSGRLNKEPLSFCSEHPLKWHSEFKIATLLVEKAHHDSGHQGVWHVESQLQVTLSNICDQKALRILKKMLNLQKTMARRIFTVPYWPQKIEMSYICISFACSPVWLPEQFISKSVMISQ